jgi:outer membrane lipoprotein carrier protein
VSDATTLWLYDPDLEQVTVRPFQRDISKTPAILFIGEVSGLDDSYQVTAHDDNGTVSYTLIPQDQQSLYREINLTFSGDKPVAMSLLDTLGQQTRIDLSDVQSNQAIDPLLFDFVVPDGADVLYDD